ncbi:PepP Xaa-Pro aminopeptidase [Candidatus Nanopelagicaceae bacterium]
MNHSEAFAGKIDALRALMTEKKLDALILRRNPNLAWAISGRAHVPTTIDAACFDLVITEDATFAVTNAIEAPRLAAEEFPPHLEIKIVQWWEGRNNGLAENLAVGSDQPGPGLTDLSLEIEMLRASLDSYDQNRIATISERAAKALGDALKGVTSSDREIDVAARITSALWQSNLEISFLGVAGQSRVKLFRHPLPTDALVGNRVSASICAKEKGLIASVTRIVTFGAPSSQEESEYASILEVEADLLDATIVGKPFSSVVDVAIRSYGEHGFDSDEWHHHHQGGPSGFLPRDWPATQSSARLIQENQVIAWNPTGKGWKAEDTIITSSSGIKIVSIDSSWPTREVRGRIRPDLLRK